MDETLEKIKDIIKIIDDLENKNDNSAKDQSNSDLAVSDLYHYIENNDFTPTKAAKVLKELKTKLKDRREVKQTQELLKTFFLHIKKLENADNRKILLNEMNKRYKDLQKEYNNRIYTEEDIEDI